MVFYRVGLFGREYVGKISVISCFGSVRFFYRFRRGRFERDIVELDSRFNKWVFEFLIVRLDVGLFLGR